MVKMGIKRAAVGAQETRSANSRMARGRCSSGKLSNRLQMRLISVVSSEKAAL
jgi:hypothetical protein